MLASRTMFAVTAGLLLAAAPGAARADIGRTPQAPRDLTPLGEYLLVGGGVTDFAKEATKDRFDVGGAWDLRLGIGNRFYVGAEAAYVGAAAHGTGSGPDLMMNGAEGVIRLQYPGTAGRWLVEPFAFGGLGWSRLSLDHAPAGVKDSDDVGVVPFGAGITIGRDRLLLDARFTYRTTFNEDLVLGASQGTPNLQRWSVGASMGYAFSPARRGPRLR